MPAAIVAGIFFCDKSGIDNGSQEPEHDRFRVGSWIHSLRWESPWQCYNATYNFVRMKSTSVSLHNARLVLPSQTIDPAGLLVENGRIARVLNPTEQSAVSPSAIDLHGLTVFPGFIDLHIHGAVGVDTLTASAQ